MDRYGQMSKWDDVMMCCSVGLLFVFSIIPWIIGDDSSLLFSISIMVYIVIWIITIVALCNAPLDISVSNSFLRLNFPFRKRMILMDEVKSAKVIDGDDIFVRKIRFRGYFGWWGKYHNNVMGSVRVYASNLRNLVLVELKEGKNILLSCNDAPLLAETINKRMRKER